MNHYYRDFLKMIRDMDDQRKPFVEHKLNNCIIRVFNSQAPKHLFKWHSDDKHRLLEVLTDTDWQFQFDDKHPFQMKQGQKILVEKGLQHRVIPGSSSLWIRIVEKD